MAIPRKVLPIVRLLIAGFLAANGGQALAGSIPRIVLKPDNRIPPAFDGYERMTRNDFDGAIAAFSRVIQNDPKPVMAYLSQALAYLSKKDYTDALADADSAIKLDSKCGAAFTSRSLIYLAEDDYANAVSDQNEAIRLDPTNPLRYYERGVIYLQSGDLDHAIADFSHVLQDDLTARNGPKPVTVEDTTPTYGVVEVDRDGWRPQHYRGFAYLRKNDFARADEDFTQAIRLDPKSADDYLKRGVARIGEVRYDQAFADFGRALELDPQNADIYNERGTLFLRQHDFLAAVGDFNMALRPDGAYNNLAWILATCPVAKYRDGKLALAAATVACNFTSWKDSISLDTFAAARAEAGDFDASVKWEQAALAQPGMSARDVADARMRLARYRSHKSYQEQPQNVPAE